ncbi:TonB-dependent receptor [Chryseosolibacter indicus]|uniref:TonB-dependent receptor n=1 Tax=Chryseosolibacter indicus TaxID=2782351 RepID=A0ABS5VKH2_9BACT|nr:TonB-dependent receptor [Chryseosolibacter indicus]MBT1701950.1 TonB-dependent receptor [Chryseosolibacter indicus]
MVKPLQSFISKLAPPGLMLLCLIVFLGYEGNASIYSSQNGSAKKNISIDVKDEPLSTVMDRIEKLSGYSFIYSNSAIDVSKRITFQVKNQNLENTLRRLFLPLGVSFSVVKDKIILKAPATSHIDVPAKYTTAYPIIGQVRDELGEGLPGVTVIVKGTTMGTSTDANGKYTINVNDTLDAVLIFSFIGYSTLEIPVRGRTEISVSMKPSVESLAEVVVVGYATQKRINLTGSVSTIEEEALESKPVTTVVQALQGTAPNLIIQQQSSEPGAQLNINIRGIGTLGDNSPLIVIDGIPSNAGVLSSINPNDIESISVLKDAASSAIYGSRSANGVLLVTTKQGSLSTKPVVTYNGIYGFQAPTFTQKPVSAYEFAMLKNEALVNSGQAPQFSPDDLTRIHNAKPNAWYMDEIFKDKAAQQSHNLSVSGGSENTTYLISLGRMNQSSSFVGPNYGYERTNARTNITTRINDRLKAGIMLAYTNNHIKEHAHTTEFIVADASRIPRLYPIKDSVGNYNIAPTSSSNPLAKLEKGGIRTHDNDNFSGNIFAELNILKDLKIRGVFGGSLWNYQTYEFRKAINYLPYIGGDGQNFIKDYNSKTLQTNAQLVADYKVTFNDHAIGVLGGYSSEGYTENNNQIRKLNVDNEFGFSTSETEIDSRESYNRRGTPWTLNSFFGRVNYNFREKYLFEANFRYDGSSRFAKGNRWGFFPSVSAGWRLTEEEFLSSIKSFANVKVRASWGKLGNQNIDPFQYTSNIRNLPDNLEYGNSGNYGFNNNSVAGAYFSSSNPDITWETSTMIDVGAEIDLLDGALLFSYDYFKKRTEDILLDLAVPGAYGADAPVVNAAVVDNEGWEMSLTYNRKGAVLNHRITANLADNLNAVVDVKGKETIEGGDRAVIIREGFPIKSYYGYRSEGLYQNLTEIEEGPKPGFVANGAVSPGDIRYVDKNADGVINERDRFVIGNPFPRYTFGLTYGLTWKNFDFSFFIQGVGKRNLYLRGESVEAFHNNWENVYEQHLDRWTPTNPDATYPRLTIGTASTNNNAGSDYWLLNAAYARLKNVQIGYSLPNSLANKIGLNNLRVYLTGQNLLTVTEMNNGYDPEISEFNSSLATSDGKVNSGRVYPNLKVYALGVDISF